MKLKPWYDVVKPRKDLCAGRVPEAAEFAVHLDHVRDGRAQEEYTNPAEFFTRSVSSVFWLGWACLSLADSKNSAAAWHIFFGRFQ